MKLYARIARTLDALQRCEASDPPMTEAALVHRATLKALLDEMPSGAGWDAGTKLDKATSSPEKLIFYGSYHHMNDGGFYDGWTEHSIIVTPSLAFDFNLKVTGRDRNDIKDYLAEMFDSMLRQDERVAAGA